MKYLLLLVVSMIISNLSAQNKQDYIWFFGKDQSFDNGIQASKFDFNNKPFAPSSREEGLEFDRNNASISNKDGELLFYSNGCAVANKDHEIMPNGEGINDGVFFQDFWGSGGDCGDGYPGRQDITILPDPANQEGYYLIHKKAEFNSDFTTILIDTLYYSYVDMNLDNGNGDVTTKNQAIVIDEFLWSYLTTIRHSNGNDWWIVNPLLRNSSFIKILLTESGFEIPSYQQIGNFDFAVNSSASGDAKFSPDGTKYAYFNSYDGMLLCDFDRTSGELSNLKHIDFPEPSEVRFATCEWSPNSRFLYLIEKFQIWQVDTWEEDVESSMILVGEYNGVTDPVSTAFFVSTLGPDCRIYIRPGSSTNSFHVIHKPNEKGIACDLVQQGIRLPRISATGSFPNFPRFRVDEEDKCDPSILSIAGEDIYWRRDLLAYPNPCQDYTTLKIPDGKIGELYVVNMDGQIVKHVKDIHQKEFRLDMSDLSLGNYSIEYVPDDNKDRVVYTAQVIKVE